MKFNYMTWEDAARFCEKTFGVYVDWENENLVMCPICETYWTDIE